MKKIHLFLLCILPAIASFGQTLALNDFNALTLLAPSKFNSYLINFGFLPAGKQYEDDTVANLYSYRRIISGPGKLNTIINKSIAQYDFKGESSFTYRTNMLSDFLQLKEQLKQAGYLYNTASDSIAGLLYQKEDMTLYSFVSDTNNTKLYGFKVKRKQLPRTKNIRYAEDLLQFTSHEYLAYVFGEKNVKKDVYFFSEKELAKCSVLFLNTDRQAVFLWEDEENNCTLSNILIGGQQMLKSSLEHNNFVEQNSWRLKNGMHAGMTLYQLRMLNGQDFKFYSGNSDQTGMVLPDITGKINFEQQGVILGCMNCRDSKFLTSTVMSAEEAISEERILFVLSIILSPISATP